LRRLEHLATRALNAAASSPTPRWPFAQTVLRHLRETSPRIFAERVRGMIEALVTACQEEPQAAAREPFTTFTAGAPFKQGLPFLDLHPDLSLDPAVALEPTNFALPAVKAEEPWPPAEANMVRAFPPAIPRLAVLSCALLTMVARRRGTDSPGLPSRRPAAAHH
jgi:hypothetical protein